MKNRKLILLCFVVLLLLVFSFSAFQVYRELSARRQERSDFDALAQLVLSPAAKPSPTPEPSPKATDAAAQPTPEATPEPTPEPTPETAAQRDLQALFQQNSECVGWICIPDTAINYPVMHTPDDPEKYLHLNFYGQYSYSGVPFLDARCSLDHGNRILYGHNMKDGSMFRDLKLYADPEFRESHAVIEFQTAEGSTFYTVTQVRITDTSDEWYSLLETETRYLLLSTCYGSNKDGRILVIAAENPQPENTISTGGS